ncbi:hypothetical protein ACQUSY_03465 [Microbacterium sp. YY-03]
MRDEDVRVRRGVAENPNLDAALLRLLATDEDRMVRLSVASNPQTPQAVLGDLSRDPDRSIAEEATSRIS